MKQKSEISEFAPWEQEGKGMSKTKKRSIPSKSQRSMLCSKPKAKDQDFLELYTLSREKERLEKYGSTLGRRVKAIASMWKESKSRMYELQNKSARVGKEGIEKLIKSKKEKEAEKKGIVTEGIEKMDWKY